MLQQYQCNKDISVTKIHVLMLLRYQCYKDIYQYYKDISVIKIAMLQSNVSKISVKDISVSKICMLQRYPCYRVLSYKDITVTKI